MTEEIKNGKYEEYDGVTRWYKNNQLHRDNGPAMEYHCMTYNHKQEECGIILEQWWYKNGVLHREDGPAYKMADDEQYFLNGEELTKDEFNRYLIKKPPTSEKINEWLNHKPLGWLCLFCMFIITWGMVIWFSTLGFIGGLIGWLIIPMIIFFGIPNFIGNSWDKIVKIITKLKGD